MGFTCGIIGLPNAGKSTVFNALTGAGAMIAGYAFSTVEPNHGVVPVPDSRLAKLSTLLGKKNPIPTRIEFTDLAGLVKGASKGEGLGNQFLGHIRTVDALVHVVRCFASEEALHVMGSVDPVRDIEVVDTELILADMEIAERARQKAAHATRVGDKGEKLHAEQCVALLKHLDAGQPLRTLPEKSHFEELIHQLGVITSKPVLYLANLDEKTPGSQVEAVKAHADRTRAPFLAVLGKVEEELSRLPPGERGEFAQAMGIERSGLERLIETCYALLGLITFYTSTTDLQAWTIPKGTNAARAAGKIHTDFERGFIRAEVARFDDLLRAGSEHQARVLGLLRAEGREYEVHDGDVIHYLFNV